MATHTPAARGRRSQRQMEVAAQGQVSEATKEEAKPVLPREAAALSLEPTRRCLRASL